jgi:hypothetical protein
MVNEDRFDKLLHDNPDYTLLSRSKLTRVARDAGISKNEIDAYFQRGSVKQQNEQFNPYTHPVPPTPYPLLPANTWKE